MQDSNIINYSSANNIRIKLLLLIDKEIHKINNHKSPLYKINKLKTIKINGFDLNFEEKYIQNKSITQFNQSTSYNFQTFETKEISSISPCSVSPPIKINIPKRKLSNKSITKDIFKYLCSPKRTYTFNNSDNGNNDLKLKSNNINYNGEKYSIKMKKQLSSVVMIYKKPKNDKKFLKNLCESLKISKKPKNKFNSKKYIALSKSKEKVKKKYYNKTQNGTDDDGTFTRKNVEIIKKQKSKIFSIFREKNNNNGIAPNAINFLRTKSSQEEINFFEIICKTQC